MKNKANLFLVSSLLILAGLFVYFKIHNPYLRYKLNGKTYNLAVAKNPLEWKRGLMYYKEPVSFDGMIFVFKDSQVRTFWNKNTHFNLDVYWLQDDKVIGKSYLPSIDYSGLVTIQSPKPVNKVIEIIK